MYISDGFPQVLFKPFDWNQKCSGRFGSLQMHLNCVPCKDGVLMGSVNSQSRALLHASLTQSQSHSFNLCLNTHMEALWPDVRCLPTDTSACGPDSWGIYPLTLQLVGEPANHNHMNNAHRDLGLYVSCKLNLKLKITVLTLWPSPHSVTANRFMCPQHDQHMCTHTSC